jgi:hypothetical protein
VGLGAAVTLRGVTTTDVFGFGDGFGLGAPWAEVSVQAVNVALSNRALHACSFIKTPWGSSFHEF